LASVATPAAVALRLARRVAPANCPGWQDYPIGGTGGGVPLTSARYVKFSSPSMLGSSPEPPTSTCLCCIAELIYRALVKCATRADHLVRRQQQEAGTIDARTILIPPTSHVAGSCRDSRNSPHPGGTAPGFRNQHLQLWFSVHVRQGVQQARWPRCHPARALGTICPGRSQIAPPSGASSGGSVKQYNRRGVIAERAAILTHAGASHQFLLHFRERAQPWDRKPRTSIRISRFDVRTRG